MVTAKITPEEREQVIMKMKAILDECNHNKNLVDNIPLKIEKIAELFELMLSDLGKFFLAQKNSQRVRQIVLNKIDEFNAKEEVREHENLQQLMDDTYEYIINLNRGDEIEAQEQAQEAEQAEAQYDEVHALAQARQQELEDQEEQEIRGCNDCSTH